LFASAAAEVGEDLTQSALRAKQANRVQDSVFGATAQAAAQQGHHAQASVAHCTPLTAQALTTMTVGAILREFMRRYDALNWAQTNLDTASPETVRLQCSAMLALPGTSIAAEQKLRFRALAKVLHPDKCKLKGSTDVFQALRQAQSLLACN
jgi:hypothetical protein